ncbi:MAG: hypothetical protein RR764_07770 [Oscillospiraceae bacterium]
MEKDMFNKFIIKSGIKKNFIAAQICVPNWVISNWLASRGILTKNQHIKLDKFVNEFIQSNKYMK